MDSLITPEIFKNVPEAYILAVVLALIPIVLKTISALINFYEDVLLKRYFNRLQFLSEHADKDTEILYYIKNVKVNEIYRMSSGISVRPEKSQLMMDIFNMGIADNKELKSIQHYLTPRESKTEITFSWFDKVLIMYSLLSGIFLMTLGIIYAISFQFEGLVNSIVGFIVMFAFMLIGGIILKDYRKYRVLYRVNQELKARNELCTSSATVSLINFQKKQDIPP